MLGIKLKNFRSFRDLNITMSDKLNVVVGYNEAGKSTLVNSIKFAMLREAFGVRGTKNIKKLITKGENSLAVTVEIDGKVFHQTTTTGTAIRTVADDLNISTDVLPLVLDASLCRDGGNRHWKAFLSTLGTLRFNPLTAFAEDPNVLPHIEQAYAAGRRDAKSVIKFCEDTRAQQKPPTQPMAPSIPRQTDTDAQAHRLALQTAQNAIAALAAKISEIESRSGLVSACRSYKTALEAYEIASAEVIDDPLPVEARRNLETVTHFTGAALQAMIPTLQSVGYTDTAAALQTAVQHVQHAVAKAKQTLEANPRPPAAPIPPTLAPQALPIWEEFGGISATAETLSAAANALLEESTALRKQHAEQAAGVQRLQEAYDLCTRSIGAWSAYDTAMESYDAQVSAAKDRWNRWDHAAKAIAEAEKSYLASVGDSFHKLVLQIAGPLLQNRPLTISEEHGIMLGSVPVKELSESTQWRVEVAVMAAVAMYCRSPILMIDGADILDVRNKSTFMTFLLQQVVPHFSHVLVTSTCVRELADEPSFPESLDAQKWVIDNGAITKR